MQCQCCKNHDVECLLPPVQAPSCHPDKGLRIPACVRCALYGYTCSIFDSVPNDHRWYPRKDGTFDHRPAPKSIIKEDEAYCRKVSGKKVKDHDHAIEERKWEPHFEAYKFVQQNPSVIQLIMEQDAEFQAKGGCCKASHGQHPSHSAHHRFGEGGSDTCSSSSSSRDHSSHDAPAGGETSPLDGATSEVEVEKEDQGKDDTAQIVSRNLSDLTRSLLRSVEDYADTLVLAKHLGETSNKEENANADVGEEAKQLVHSRAMAKLEDFKEAVKLIVETVNSKLSLGLTVVNCMNFTDPAEDPC
ncbi:hypothetical protein IAT40_001354 [Kwoniella sp. CBS 6097]